MKRLLSLIFSIGLLLAESSQASIIDAPHNETHNIKCGTCHTYSLWWKDSPTTSNPVNHKVIVDAVCMTCHQGGGSGPKAFAHTQYSSPAYDPPWLGEGCMACHNPHYQRQLEHTPASYLVTGLITGVVSPGSLPNGDIISTIPYTVDTPNGNWPAVGASPELPDWANKSPVTPDRGLILVQDTNKKSNTFNIVSATASEIVVRGVLDPAEVVASSCTNPGTCETFGLIYGQLIKETIAGKEVKFFDPNGGFVGDGSTTTGLCQVCHTRTSRYTSTDPTYPQDTHDGRENINCMSCHRHDLSFEGIGAHDSSDFAWAGNCATCHDSDTQNPVVNIVDETHRLKCGMCHVNSKGGGPLQDGPSANGVDGSALLATKLSSCEDCHITPSRMSGGIHHDSFNDYAANGDCVRCHEDAIGKLKADHSIKVGGATGCIGCHSVTAGTISGIPVNPDASKVHDACTTCHHNSGVLKTALEADDPGTVATVIAMVAGDCVECHGEVVHSSLPHDTRVIPSAQCTVCHTETAGTASGIPVNPGDNKIHDACITCHAANGLLLSVAAADNAGTKATVTAMVVGTCVDCHGAVSHTDMSHDVRVASSSECTTCHTATAGTTSGMPLSSTDNKVHDACTTCHDGNGLLLSVAAANNGGTKASVTNMVAGNCVGCHGAVSHTDMPHTTKVASNTECTGCHTATAGTLSGIPLSTSDNKVHDACTTCHDANGQLLSEAAANNATTTATVIAMVAGDCVDCHGVVSHSSLPHDTRVSQSTQCSYCHAATAGTVSGMPVDLINNKLHDACTTCHADNGLLLDVVLANNETTKATVTAMATGNCVGCHGVVSHADMPHDTRVTSSAECTGCHTATAGTASGMPLSTGDNKVHDACTTCHDGNGVLLSLVAANNGTTKATVTAMVAGNCVGCHGAVSHNDMPHTAKVSSSPECTICHSATAGSATGIPVSTGDNKVHDACTTCHSATTGLLLTVEAANNGATKATVSAMVAGNCVACHGTVSHIDMPHTSRVTSSSECTSCHTATAGTASGIPVSTGDNKVHDACTTCHDANGLLLTVVAANNGTTKASVTGMVAGNCVGCHGVVSHTDMPHTSKVTSSTECTSCHTATAGSASGIPVNTSDNKVHDACTTCHDSNGLLLSVVAANNGATKASVSAMVAGNCVACHGTVSHNDMPHTTKVTSSTECTSCHTATVGTAAGIPVNNSDNKVHDACTTCHDGNGLLLSVVAANNGATKASVSAMVAGNCVACHGAVSHNDMPHTTKVTSSTECTSCHTATVGTASGIPVNTGDNKVHDACTTCHDANGLLLSVGAANNGSTKATVSAMVAGNCVACHGVVSHTDMPHTIKVTSSAECTSCHTATVGTASGIPVSTTDNKVHDACTTCHDANGLLLSVGDANNAGTKATVTAMVAGNCVACHGVVSHTDMPHTTKVSSSAECTSCHTGTVGTTSGIPLSSGDNKVHDACTTCHDANGLLLSVGAANNAGTKATVTAMVAGNCVGCHGAVSHNDMAHETRVASSSVCIGCHTGTAGTASGVPLSTSDNKVHDACTTCHGANSTLLSLAEANNETTTATVIAMEAGDCIACHGNLDHGNLPHDTRVIQATQCAHCHAVTAGTVNGIPVDPANAKIHDACTTCHDANGFLLSMAAANNAGTKATVTAMVLGDCIACHDVVSHTDMPHTTKITSSPECTSCHSATAGNASGIPLSTGDNKVHDACTTCHDANGVLLTVVAANNGATKATVTAMVAGNCVGCHGANSHDNMAHATKVTSSPECTSCHTATAGTASGIPLSTIDNKVHDACTTCHSATTGLLLSVGAANNGATKASVTAMVAGNCVACHGTVSHTDMPHTTKVTSSGECTSCHTATAGTGSGIPVSTGDNKVHDACTTCHDANGLLLSVGAANNGATKATVTAMVAGNCVACHGVVSHTDMPHTSKVTSSAECTSCHTSTAGTASGIPVSTGDNKVHDACTTCHDASTGLLLTLAAANNGATKATVSAMVAGNCVACHGVVSHTDMPHTSKVTASTECTSCHTATAGTASGIPVNNSDNKVHDGCTTCHDANGLLLSVAAANNGATKATVTSMVAGNCVACHGVVSHNDMPHTSKVTSSTECTSCHTATAGTASGIPVSTSDNKVHDACTTCHDANGLLLSVVAANNGATKATVTAMGAGNCVTCHGVVSHNDMPHTSKVTSSTECTSCHTATAGTASGIPVSTADNKVHDACTTCHDGNGLLLSVAAANNGSTKATVTAMAAGNCVACHGPYQGPDHGSHLTKVTSSAECTSCHTATAGTASGIPVSSADNKVHDNCGTCHSATTGLLLSVAAANNGSTKATVTAMVAGNCVACHGTNSHDNMPHTTKVTSSTECTSCHTATAGTASGIPVSTGDNKVHDACTTCHDANGLLLSLVAANNAGTKATVTAMVAGNCVACHGTVSHTDMPHTTKVTSSPECTSCHTATAGTASGIPVNNTDNKVHDACTTCHSATTGLLLAVGDANNGSTKATVTSMVAGNCVACHGVVSHNDMPHTAKVTSSTECTSCHTATAGTASGISVNTSDNKVHDACTTCHDANGLLLSVVAANNGATKATVSSMVAGNCVACHGAVSHTDMPHTSKVTSSTECTSCHTATAGTASGIPVSTGDNKVHDACTTCHDANGVLLSVAAANNGATKATVTSMVAGNCVACHGVVSHNDMPHTTKVTSSTECTSCHTATAGTASGIPVNTGDNKVHDACTTCHDANGLLLSVGAANNGATKATVTSMAAGTCVGCHGPVSHNDMAHTTKVTSATECTGCHTATAGTASGIPLSTSDNKVHDACTTCHDANGLLLSLAAANNAGTTATVIAMAAGDCIVCHGNVDHSSLPHDTRAYQATQCSYCHAATAGTASGMPIDPANAKIHDACTTCHGANGLLLSVAAANNATTKATVTFMVLGDCIACHDEVSHTDMPHTARVSSSTECTSCHTATAGTASGIPVSSGNNKVHDACTTCHDANGLLLSVAAANNAGTKATVSAMVAGNCVACHGAVSHNDMPHTTKVTSSAECTSCHTGTAGTASGIPVSTGDNKVHDACTTCHDANGLLLSVAAANNGATKAAVTAMVAGNCVACHGSVSHNDMPHTTKVTSSTECTSCHTATAGTASGIPVSTGDNKVHDACTTCHSPTTGLLLSLAAANNAGTKATVSAMVAGNCVACHGTVSHNDMPHATKVTSSPECTSCHTATAGTASGMPVNTGDNKVHDACTTCHAANGLLLTVGAANNGATKATVTAMVAGNCVACHGVVSHTDMPHTAKVTATTECAVCHTATAGTASGIPVNNSDNKVHDACTTCHDANGLLLSLAAANNGTTKATVIAMGTGDCVFCHGAVSHGHDATHFAGSAVCTTCHTIPAEGIVVGIHNNLCLTCHTSAGGGTGTTKVGDAAGGIDGNAILGNSAVPHASVTCLTCHPVATYPTGAIHHDDDSMPNCVFCHTGTYGGNHSLRVQASANCSITCHATVDVVGTTTGIKIDPANAKVHDSCLTCHTSTATLKGSYSYLRVDGKTVSITMPASGGTNNCNTCHGAYFVTHGKASHITRVATSTGCNSCHLNNTIVGTLTSVPVDPADPKVHDACTTCHNATTGAANSTTTNAPARPAGGGACEACHQTRYFDGHSHPGHNTSVMVNQVITPATVNCVSAGCHVATSTPFVGGGQVHLACSSCHTANTGVLKGSASGKPAGGQCNTCHTAYFNGHALHNATTHAVLQRATDLAAGAACNTCHSTFANNWPGILGLHSGGCAMCHDSTRTTLTNPAGGVQAIIQNDAITIGCLSCHTDRSAAHAGHAVDFGKSTQCTSCHTGASVMVNIHGNGTSSTCAICHSGTPNRTNEMLGSAANGVDGDARLADGTAAANNWGTKNCLTCHPIATYPAKGVHHDTANATAGMCDSCHVNPATGGIGTPVAVVPTAATFTQLSCVKCHVVSTGTGLVLRKLRLGNASGARPTQLDVAGWTTHNISHTAKINVYDFKSCFSCHNGANPSFPLAKAAMPFHGFPGDLKRESLIGTNGTTLLTGFARKTMLTGGTYSGQMAINEANGNNLPLVYQFYHPGHREMRRFSTPGSANGFTLATNAITRRAKKGNANERLYYDTTDGWWSTTSNTVAGSTARQLFDNGTAFPSPGLEKVQYGGSVTSYTTGFTKTLPGSQWEAKGYTQTFTAPYTRFNVAAKPAVSTTGQPKAAGFTLVPFWPAIAAPGAQLSWKSISTTVSEGVGTVVLTATRKAGSTLAVGATVTPSGTATNSTDYTFTPTTLSWAAGVSGDKTVTITVINDATVESLETIILTLTSPTGTGTTITGSPVTTSIADNDGDTTGPVDGTLSMVPNTTQLTLNWTAATDASGLRGTNPYEVRFQAGATAPSCSGGTMIYTGSALTYAHTGLTTGSTYSYRVCAYDSIGNVSTGATGSGVPVAPDTSAPTVGTVTVNPISGTFITASPTITATLTEAQSTVTSCQYTTDGSTWIAGVVSGSASPWTCTGSPTGLATGAKTINVRGTNNFDLTGTGTSVARTVDIAAPTVSVLTVTPGNTQNALTWTASTDAGSGMRTTNTYDVRYGIAPTCSTGTSAYTGTALSYTHTNLKNGDTYDYVVCAYDNLNNVSASVMKSGTPVATEDTTAPIIGTITVTSTSGIYTSAAPVITATLTDAESTVSSCQYTTNGGSTWLTGVKSGTSSPWTCTGSPTGLSGALTINVRATNSFVLTGTGSQVTRTVETTVPVHTGSVTATPTTGQIALSWPAATDAVPGMHGTTPYKVVRANGTTVPACTATAIYTGTLTSFTNTGLPASTQYTYKVCAYDAVNNVTPGLTVTATTPAVADTTPPTHTGTLAATAISSSQIDLSWPTATDSGSGMHVTTPYKVVRANGGTAPADCSGTAIYSGTAVSFSNTGLTESTQYSYRVCAYDVANNVTTGMTATSTTPAPPDTTPPTHTGSLTATAASSSQINLSWPAATDAASGMHSTTPYKVVGATGAAAPANCTGTAIYTGTALSFNVTGLTASTQYSYRVCAYDVANNVTTGLTASATTQAIAVSTAPTVLGTAAFIAGGSASDPITITGFTAPAGTNRVLVIYAGSENGTGPSVVTVTSTFNSLNPTTIFQQNDGRDSQWFGYIPLGTGGAITSDISIDWDAASADGYLWAVVYENAAQTQTLNWATTSTTNNLSTTINAPSNARVIYATHWNGADTSGSFLTSPTTDTWTRYVEDDATGGWHCGIEARNETTADASLVIDPANTGTTSNRSSLLVIAVEPAAGAPANQPPAFSPTSFSKADATVGVAYSGQTIAGTATDPESDPITYSKVSGPAWLSVAGNGALSGTPTAAAAPDTFVVRATATGGTADGTLTITVQSAADTTPPTHTGSLTATAVSTTQINLSWPAATDAGSGMHATTPYKVVRATGATAPANCTGTAIYSGTDLTFSNTGLTVSTQYSYRVCAYDAANNVTTGLTASATTLGAATDVTYYVTPGSATNVGVDGNTTYISDAPADNPPIRSMMGVSTANPLWSYRPALPAQGVWTTLMRAYTPVYDSAKSISAAASAAFAIRGYNASDQWRFNIYSYNPSGSAMNKTLVLSSSVHTSGTGATVTLNPTYTGSGSIPAGHRLLLEVDYNRGGTSTSVPRIYNSSSTYTVTEQ